MVRSWMSAPASRAKRASPAWYLAGWMAPVRSSTTPARKAVEPISSAQVGLGHEADRLTQLAAVLVGHGRQRLDVGLVVGQVELSAAPVVAVEGLVGHQRLQLVEGLVHLLVHPGADRPVAGAQPTGTGLELGDHHPAVAGAGAAPQRVTIDHHHRAPVSGQDPGRGQPAVARAHHHHVHLGGQRDARTRPVGRPGAATGRPRRNRPTTGLGRARTRSDEAHGTLRDEGRIPGAGGEPRPGVRGAAMADSAAPGSTDRRPSPRPES